MKRIIQIYSRFIIAFSVAICCSLGMFSELHAQTKLSLNIKNASAKELFDEINRQTGLSFIYSNNDVDAIPKRSYIMPNGSVAEALNMCLNGTTLTFIIENKTIYIKQKPASKPISQATVIKGVVKDIKGNPMPFANVIVKNSSIGCATTEDGTFELIITPTAFQSTDITLLFTYVETKPVEIKYAGQKFIEVTLNPGSEIDEVVVTGIYVRKKESFTGSSSTFTADELKRVGSQNVIQSLKSLDPSFNVLDNNLFGSDPNRLPDIEIRGKSSIVGLKEQYGTDPNQPLFILDGFETTLQTVMDLNMDRVGSVTLLKDAASTAIYGSKAANGVVVIETRAPEKGSLRLSYKGDFEVSIPDLSGYNLMNSSEKLEFEKRAGRYSSIDPRLNLNLDSLYQFRRTEIVRGVDTYWLSEPVRTSFTHKHNLYIEGGDDVLRYGVGLNYNGIAGVMKNSQRDVLGGSIDLLYRKGAFRFSNKLSVDYVNTTDPMVSFKEFAQTNPYYRKTDANGEVIQYLERSLLSTLEPNDVQNPMWDMALNNYDRSAQSGIRNNFIAEYQPIEALRIRARFSLTQNTTKQEQFFDPQHSKFNNISPMLRGEYINNSTDYLKYEGDITVGYGKLFAEKHQLNLLGGWSFSDYNQEIIGFSTVGFNSGLFNRPSFSGGYPDGDKPLSMENRSRATSFFFNGGYSYDNKYLFDFNYRLDGSSVFGSNRKFTNTWSVGVAWNMHSEEFIRQLGWINLFKIRYSIGNPGNQNFDSYLAYTTYKYNETFLNNFGNGITIVNVGNPNLLWQKTLDQNIGLDFSYLNNRGSVVVDLYSKKTDPLLARINMPSSTGVKEVNTNIGLQTTQGISATVKFSPIYNLNERINWSLSINMLHERSEYDGIGNKLDAMNKANRLGKSYQRFYDGGSPDDIWAVRSAYIDPATGQELFVNKNGETTTFIHAFDNEVVVGNKKPSLEGVISSVLFYKGFSFSMYFRYRLMGDVFNKAVYDKVENISLSGLKMNQDKRALYDRWQKPGDHAQFKSISVTEETPMSSRFVMTDNTIIGESFQVGYEFSGDWLKKIGLSSMTVQALANNLLRLSSVKDERGIEYPFARTATLSISLTF